MRRLQFNVAILQGIEYSYDTSANNITATTINTTVDTSSEIEVSGIVNLSSEVTTNGLANSPAIELNFDLSRIEMNASNTDNNDNWSDTSSGNTENMPMLVPRVRRNAPNELDDDSSDESSILPVLGGDDSSSDSDEEILRDWEWLGEEEDNNNNDASSETQSSEEPEIVLTQTVPIFDKFTEYTWVGDTAASNDMKNNTDGMFNLRPYVRPVTVGNSDEMMTTFIGDFVGDVLTKDGQLVRVARVNVLVVPELWTNLWSLSKDVADPTCDLKKVDGTIHVASDGRTVKFDRVFPAGTGKLYGVEVLPETFEKETANITAPKKKIAIETMHAMFGHPDEAVSRQTAKALGIELRKGSMKKCKYCAIGKAKRKNLSKTNHKKSKKKGGRVYIDISSTKARSFGGSKFWALMQDEATDMCWSMFLKNKSELKHKAIPLIKKIKKRTGVNIEVIRCDNAGENKSLQEAIDLDPDLNIKFEYTAPNTPQQNGVVERKFATLYGRVRSMLNAAEVPKTLREKLWAYAAKMATELDTILVKPGEDSSAIMKFYGDNPPWIVNLRPFGEVGIISNQSNKNIRGKLEDRGSPALFVGFPEDHAEDVYSMIKLENKSAVKSRDIIWLGQTYAEYKGIKTVVREISREDNSDSDSDDELQEGEDQEGNTQHQDQEAEDNADDEDDVAPDPVTPIPHKLMIELKRLNTSYNPTMESASVTKSKESQKKVKWKEQLEEYGPIAMVGYMPAATFEPRNVNEAKSENWEGWWTGCKKEFKDMEARGVWDITPKSSMPKGRRLVGCKWVFKQKDNGVFRSRLCAQGFTQKAGIDFQENFAPVVNDVTFRIALVLKLLFDLEDEQFDVETAFLYGDLDEEIYMTFPELYNDYLKETGRETYDPDKYCLRLKKACYGLVQAARQWWIKFKQELKTLGYLPSPADPCMFFNQDTENPSYIFIYVDDGGIMGTRGTIENVLSKISDHFVIKRLGPLESFVGCVITVNEKKDTMWITQPKLIGHLKEKFNDQVPKKTVAIPAGPGFTVIRPQEGDPLIESQKQSMYRTGVGMLLYLIKLSRPEISNSVRELTKVLDGATETHYKAMLRVIKFIFETEFHGLTLHPVFQDGLFKLRGLCDSDFAGDKDTRISVYGFILYFCGCPIAWRSKSGKSVTLSSTEAEYVAISELAKEIMFVKQLLESLGIFLTLPIIVQVDNVGAIYLAYNHTVSQRTKHMDCKMHYVREYVEDGVLQVIFVSTDDNDSDIFTKNTSQKVFNKHTPKFLQEVPSEVRAKLVQKDAGKGKKNKDGN